MNTNAIMLILMIMAIMMAMIFLLGACVGKKEGAAVDQEKITDTYQGLRNQVLKLSARDIGIQLKSETQPWALLMEFGFKEAVVTLVAFGNGEASLYFSSGGGVIGGGGYESVRKAAKELIAFSETLLQEMKPVSTYPLPKIGNVRFLVLTGQGIYSSPEFPETELGDKKSKFSPLYQKGHDLITALRLASGKNRDSEE